MQHNRLTFLIRFLGFGMLLSSSAVFAAPATPFICDGTVYISDAARQGKPTHLLAMDRIAEPYTLHNVLSGNATLSSATLNGLGYNPVDNYMYAMRREIIGSVGNRLGIVRIGTEGLRAFSTVSGQLDYIPVSGLPATAGNANYVQAGAFDREGNYYLALDHNAGNGSPIYIIQKLEDVKEYPEVNPPAAVIATLIDRIADPAPPAGFEGIDPKDAPLGDFAVNPAESTPTRTVLYGMHSGGSGSYRLFRYVIENPTAPDPKAYVSYINTHIALAPSNATGSVFFDSVGDLYVYKNNGDLYYVDHNNPDANNIAPARKVTSFEGGGVQVSDGAVCAFNVQKVDVVKSTTGPVAVGGSTTTFTVPYTILVGNTSPTDALPNVQVSENLRATFSTGAPTLTLAGGPTVTHKPTTASCTLNPGFNGATGTAAPDYRLLDGNDDLLPGESCTISFTVKIEYPSEAAVPGAGAPQQNTAYASSVINGPNPGHSWPTPDTKDPNTPPNVIAADRSSNVQTLPTTPNADTPGATPVTLPPSPPPLLPSPQPDRREEVGVKTVTLDVLHNDDDTGTGLLDPTTVQIVSAPGDGKTLKVNEGGPNEGTWTVDPSTGMITFTPTDPATFTGSPDPIQYTVATTDGTALPATEAKVTYLTPPQPDATTLPAGTTATLKVLDNDGNTGLLDPATVKIVGAPGDGKTLTVPGEGTWVVDPVSGTITFTPEPGFTGNPTPIRYTVATYTGTRLPPATVTVTYLSTVPRPTPAPDLERGEISKPVTVDVLANDGSPALLNPATVKIVGAPGDGKTLTVPGEGTWTVDPVSGAITFTPEPGFTGNPTRIQYTVALRSGTVLPATTVTVLYEDGGGTVTPIPTLGTLATVLLGMLTAAIGLFARRRRF